MVPIDSLVCQLVHRLRFFRSFDPLPFDSRLLAPPRHKQTLVKQLRSYLPDVVAAVGIRTRIASHQLRHTYASELVRAGLGFPVLMKLLGHVNPEMTMLSPEPICNGNFISPDRNPGTLRRNQKPRTLRRAAVWTASSIRCCSPSTPSRCSAVRCRTALPSIASTSSPIDSPRSSQKPTSSNLRDSGQRLAA
jgi:hypothetical protein